MKTFKEAVGKKLDKIFCDVCGSNCMKEDAHDNEYATLSATWGYDSNKDLTRHDIDLCESCFDKTVQFLKQIRTVKMEKDPFSGEEYGLV